MSLGDADSPDDNEFADAAGRLTAGSKGASRPAHADDPTTGSAPASPATPAELARAPVAMARPRDREEPDSAAVRPARADEVASATASRAADPEGDTADSARASRLDDDAAGSADAAHTPPRTQSSAGPEFAQSSPWPGLSRAPPLALLAATAALCHVVLYRVLLPLLGSKGLALPTLLHLAVPYSLNLAACAGMVAFTIGTIDLTFASGLTYLGRRMMIALLAVIVVLVLALATFLPHGYVSPQLVLLSAGALHAFVVQVAMTTFRAQNTLAARTTAALVAVASLFPLLSLIVRHTEPAARWPFAHEGIVSLNALGELAYLLVPIAAAFVVLPWSDDVSGRAVRRAGAVAVCLMALLFGAAARIPNALYGHVMYSTLRLEWALERASLGYAVPVSLAVGAATAAFVSRDQRHRQGGVGLWLWLAGGYNPLTPARVFMTALAATLVCRAILSVGAEPSKRLA